MSAGLPVSANAINKDVGVHTKVCLNVRHRVVSPARIAERTASPEIRLKLYHTSGLPGSHQHLIAEAPRVLLHERQCRTHGGLSAATRRALAAMANETPGNAAPAGSVSAGTHLVREWNGRTYQVEVIDNGYRFDGKTYPSLTAITKRITGTHWSGPRFFGLTPKRKA